MLAQSHRTVVHLSASGVDGGTIEHGLARDGQRAAAKYRCIELHLRACEACVGRQIHRAVVGLCAAGGHRIKRQCPAAQRQIGRVVHADQTSQVIASVVQAHVGIGH